MSRIAYLVAFMLFGLCLFAGMLVLMEVGRWAGIKRRNDPGFTTDGTGPVQAAIFGLMGLLIAFTFSAAASRYEMRRQLIVQEANAIGTAYLRLDVLPAGAQPALREKFRQYLEARIAFQQKISSPNAAQTELDRAAVLQRDIWALAVAACGAGTSPAVMMLVLSALNEMIDITTTRATASRTHTPPVILGMLVVLAFACSMFAGFDMAANPRRDWFHIVGFALLIALAVYVILDLEFPRIGLIRLDLFDQVLVNLRGSIR